MNRTFFNICVIGFLLHALPAWAEDRPSPLNFKGIYTFQFSGVPFGRAGVEAEQSSSHYDITTDVTSEGVLKLFTPHTSHTTVDATGKDFAYSHIVYDTHYQTKKKKKAVKLVYKNGSVVEEVVVPPDDRSKRPAVDAALKDNAHDLLSFNLALREAVWRAVKTGKNTFSLTTFDGRRLTEVNGEYTGRKVLRRGDTKISTLRVALRRKPVAGFTRSELDDFDPKEPTLWIYYSDDEKLVPVQLEVQLFFGKIVGTLAKECRTGESCLLGIKQ